MGVKQSIEHALLKAMKEKDEIRRNVFRLALSMIKLAEVEKGSPLDESSIINILMKEVKTREEIIIDAKNAGREAMASTAQDEIIVLRQFLPKEMNDEELVQLIRNEIVISKAASLKDMGKVIKQVIEIAQGRASNERISKMVRELLNQT